MNKKIELLYNIYNKRLIFNYLFLSNYINIYITMNQNNTKLSVINIPSKIVGGKKISEYNLIVDNYNSDRINNFNYMINKFDREDKASYYYNILSLFNNMKILNIVENFTSSDIANIKFYILKLIRYYQNLFNNSDIDLKTIHLNRIKNEFNLNKYLVDALNILNNKINITTRGMFSYEEENNKFLKKGIPKFNSKEEAMKFTINLCKTQSNPEYVNLQHSITTLIDTNQINNILVTKIYEYGKNIEKNNIIHKNIFNDLENKSLIDNINELFELSLYKNLNIESTMNTLKYIIDNTRSGIFVMIRNGKVQIFSQFVNKDFNNKWSNNLYFDSSDGSIETYYREKQSYYRKENIIRDTKTWWCNAGIIDNEYSTFNRTGNQFISDSYLLELRDMFDTLCKERKISDCEFFINKRDYPQLKKSLSEPYGFMFDKEVDENIPIKNKSIRFI
jgi:hypothetical protein